MPRHARSAPAGYIYHISNHSRGKTKLFARESDFKAFQEALMAALQRVPTRLLGWCLMPDSWQMIVWPKRDGELSSFVRRLTLAHSQRRHAKANSATEGPIYQGRYRNLPVQKGQAFLDMLRFVEGSPLRAKSPKMPEDWEWSSLYARRKGPKELRDVLTDLPVALPGDWSKRVNQSIGEKELAALQHALSRSAPYGTPDWVQKTARSLKIESSLRPRGRPRKTSKRK